MVNSTIVRHTSVPSWVRNVGIRWCGAKIPISTPTVVIRNQMMKIFPIGREKNGRVGMMESPCGSTGGRRSPAVQTTWTNPDM